MSFPIAMWPKDLKVFLTDITEQMLRDGNIKKSQFHSVESMQHTRSQNYTHSYKLELSTRTI